MVAKCEKVFHSQDVVGADGNAQLNDVVIVIGASGSHDR